MCKKAARGGSLTTTSAPSQTKKVQFVPTPSEDLPSPKTTPVLPKPPLEPVDVSPPRKRKSPGSAVPASTSNPLVEQQFLGDRLGTLVSQLSQQLDSATTWSEFVNDVHGRSYLSPDMSGVRHPARQYLEELRDQGLPISMDDEEWSLEKRDACVSRGCHKTAREHAAFIREEMSDFAESGFWVVLPYEQVRHLKNLRLSPLGVKEERERRPRLVVDHTFFGVNQHTLEFAPKEAMQFGMTLPRLLYNIRKANPKFGPVYVSKYDVKDGFYRLQLRPCDAPLLATVLPRYEGEPQLIGIPLVCTMGWVNSPPTFCSMSETICDIANHRMHLRHAPPHRLDQAAETSPETKEIVPNPLLVSAEPTAAKQDSTNEATPTSPVPSLPTPQDNPSSHPHSAPLRQMDVFVDDFIGLAQGSHNELQTVRRHLLHSVDHVLDQPRPEEVTRAEAVSMKKLLKGDGKWATRKQVLGWIIDTIQGTLEIPTHRIELLHNIMNELRPLTRISLKRWQQIIGQLRFVAPGLPGSQGLFSALQYGLKFSNKGRIRITSHIKNHLRDFEYLLQNLTARPTRIAELVPDGPHLLQAIDACSHGMGGVIFTPEHEPVLWRQSFSPDIRQRVISEANPKGDITNSDLEQSAIIGGLDVASRTFDVRERTTISFTDNTPALARCRKGAVTSVEAAAYLCRLLSLHQRHNRYTTQFFHIPGTLNKMADILSRWWHLSDEEILTYFNTHFPQKKPWRLCHLDEGMNSALVSSLHKQRPEPMLYLQQDVPETPVGSNGKSFALTSTLTPTYNLPNHKPVSTSCQSMQDVSETAPIQEVASPSALLKFATPYAPLARGSPTWVSRIRDNPTLPDSFTHNSQPLLQPTAIRTLHHHDNYQQLSPCSKQPPNFHLPKTAQQASRKQSWTSWSLDSSSSAAQASMLRATTTKLRAEALPFGSVMSLSSPTWGPVYPQQRHL